MGHWARTVRLGFVLGEAPGKMLRDGLPSKETKAAVRMGWTSVALLSGCLARSPCTASTWCSFTCERIKKLPCVHVVISQRKSYNTCLYTNGQASCMQCCKTPQMGALFTKPTCTSNGQPQAAFHGSGQLMPDWVWCCMPAPTAASAVNDGRLPQHRVLQAAEQTSDEGTRAPAAYMRHTTLGGAATATATAQPHRAAHFAGVCSQER